MIVTEKGYIGIGPPICARADAVCIMPGSTVPLVLRRAKDAENSRYQLVGDAYLHGFMYGEALERVQDTSQFKPRSEFGGWKTFSIV